MKRLAWLGVALLTTGFVRETLPDGTPSEWRASCPILEIGALAPEGPNADELEGVIDQAAAAWQSDGCDDLMIDARGRASIDTVGFDGHSIVVTRPANYCDDLAHADEDICLSPGSLAITTTFSIDRPGDPRHGELLEVDLEINLHHRFATDGSATAYDLPSVVTHEIGHMLGLDHSCTTELGVHSIDPAGHAVPSCADELPAEVEDATMFPWGRIGSTARRVPQADERAAMCLIYRNRARSCSQELVAGCACNGGGGDVSLLVLGALLFVIGRVRSRASGADGCGQQNCAPRA